MKSLSIQLVALLGMVLTVNVARSEMPTWWPGSGSDTQDATAAPATATAPPAAAAEPMVESPLFDIAWPKVEMPKFSWKPSFGSKDSEVASGEPSTNPISGALDSVASASKKASGKVRGVWDSAVSKLTPGSADSAAGTQVAKKDEPSFLSRLLTSPKTEPQGSQTVTEFLAQERPGNEYK